ARARQVVRIGGRHRDAGQTAGAPREHLPRELSAAVGAGRRAHALLELQARAAQRGRPRIVAAPRVEGDALVRIYTRTGDKGDTGLLGGGRVRKDDPRVEAYGDVDELNAAIGLARSMAPVPRLDEVLAPIQRDLFSIGALLATPHPEKVREQLAKAR